MKRLVLALLVALAGCEAMSDTGGSLTILDKDIATGNGMSMNGLMTNGMKSNGMHLNGLNLNGQYKNGLNLNGKYANGLYKNGYYQNGYYQNGYYQNGLNLNGLNLNGLYTNGKFPNGLYNNGMFPNGVYNNGYLLNGLYTNGVMNNGQFPNGLSLNGLDSTLSDNTMKYLVGCAWPAGQSMTVTANGVTYTWQGKMGLGPNFGTENFGMAERKVVSACMQAETNSAGNHVMISIRGNAPSLASDAYEQSTYKYHEAYFWGDIFDEDASKVYHTSDRYGRDNGRRCGYEQIPGANACGFSMVCPGDDWVKCFRNTNHQLTQTFNGVTYEGIVTYQALEPYWDNSCNCVPGSNLCYAGYDVCDTTL